MQFRRNLLSRLYRSPDPEADSGGGGAPVVESTPVVADTPAATPAATSTPAPSSMLEAMFGQKPEGAAPTAAEEVEAAAQGKTVQQLRDERGRFASGKVDTPPVVTPDPTKKPDPNGMPDGLTPKAQERFQALANNNKELSARVQEWEPVVQSALELQKTFQANGVRREQFEQAMQVVGLMNRGDLEGALRALDGQRTQISLALGRPVPGADALANFPDLRGAVDNLQITEEHALEIARGRTQQHQGAQAAQQRQRQQEEQQRQQQAQQQSAQREEQAKNQSMLAVDNFCKARMADDLDFARVEPLLLKEIQEGLLEGVPYAARPALVEKTYRLIKQTASATRASTGSTPVLRPTGGESPRQAPKTMHEAMWGGR